jgi:hypothetical protein
MEYLLFQSASSSHRKFFSASAAEAPQNAASGLKPEQTAGRSGLPKIAHFRLSVSCTHLTKAGLPPGIPGIGELMEGKMQQAAHPGRQSIKNGI